MFQWGTDRSISRSAPRRERGTPSTSTNRVHIHVDWHSVRVAIPTKVAGVSGHEQVWSCGLAV